MLFDYGNVEVNSADTSNGHMETIYFGRRSGASVGTGEGPWILADLENRLFAHADWTVNPNNPTITDRFVTAIVKGQPGK